MTMREQGQPSPADASVGELVERLSTQVSALVRDEMALATAELKRKGAQAGADLDRAQEGLPASGHAPRSRRCSHWMRHAPRYQPCRDRLP
ncbi:MAG: phage holin family protein, partial [Pseudonocardiaceae bacterium]